MRILNRSAADEAERPQQCGAVFQLRHCKILAVYPRVTRPVNRFNRTISRAAACPLHPHLDRSGLVAASHGGFAAPELAARKSFTTRDWPPACRLHDLAHEESERPGLAGACCDGIGVAIDHATHRRQGPSSSICASPSASTITLERSGRFDTSAQTPTSQWPR